MVITLEEERQIRRQESSRGFLKIESRCVCCGELIPEGMMVCPICRANAEATEERPRIYRRGRKMADAGLQKPLVNHLLLAIPRTERKGEKL